MPTDPRTTSRLLVLLLALLCCLGGFLAFAPAAQADWKKPDAHVEYGPPKPLPAEWEGDPVGIDTEGHYCNLGKLADTDDGCRYAEAGELPGTVGICEGADGTGSAACDAEGRKDFEKERLEKWRKGARDEPTYDEYNKYLTKCVNGGKPFEDCLQLAQDKLSPPPGDAVFRWVAGQISELASDALQEVASYIGRAVVWLLQQFAQAFNDSSTIDLDQVGIGSVTGIATALSAVIATFLLLLQFAKVALSREGGPAATALAGLMKWAVISSVYLVATQTALTWSDAVSTWIINYTFDGGGSGKGDATRAMQVQLGKMFGGLITGGGGGATATGALITGQGVAAAAVGVIIVIGIVCIVAIGALWMEILLRQAGIMILVSTMPIVLAGQVSDATKEWWPKARDATIALILMKPAIVLCFAIGFGAMSEGRGVQNMLVGLMIFLLACFAWPTIAKFMTFSTVGSGASMAGGLLSTIGSSASSLQGGYRPELGGAGAVGGGAAYTRALEKDSAQNASAGSNAQVAAAQGKGGFAARLKGPGGPFGARVAAPLGLGLQVLAAGRDVLESGMANTAAHAGLDHASPGGRHVVIPPRGGMTPHQGPEPAREAHVPPPLPAAPRAPEPPEEV